MTNLVPPMQRKLLTKEEFLKLPFTYRSGMRGEKRAHRMYRNEEHHLQKELITPFFQKTQSWGNGKLYFFIDGDKNEYRNVDDFYDAYVRAYEAEQGQRALRCASLQQS